ncbi:dTDP-4-dehydrorhamnose reductase [Capillimicrobium parvum]|uniref:dTDP-4-dehydrorhamnose reductase n=1 Tax=Capillimicrobium parvum TaxID=2884022 RepID=A0A9E7C700_9ACTN|nr:dTDP-4-dehydrorhamnose reductase [Capillimicrobium parvum]UGS39043.1 dTDP-4-dehydrorhamnose reductase [Capillimicrobium parvum]
MKLLITGAGGMLGHRVCERATALGHDVAACKRADLDITDPDDCLRVVEDFGPEAIVNCAAWTDVDGAESDLDGAMAANGTGAGNIARAAADVGARIVHVSTDYVFNGDKAEPWLESDAVDPQSVYGLTKLRGEEQVADATPRHAIVRTAWVFGVGGGNFVDTMLRLGAERDEVSVVTDQVGCPTWTGHLADALIEVAERDDFGIHHIAGQGACSWNELALEIFDQAGISCRVLPTTSEAFKRPAPRPAFSVLGTERPDPIVLPPWQQGVAGHLAERKA